MHWEFYVASFLKMKKKKMFVETSFLIFDCQYSTVNIYNPKIKDHSVILVRGLVAA